MIIVTGGAGFIGSNIVKALNKASYNDILVIDNLKNGSKFLNLVDLKISDFMDKKDFIYKINSRKNFSNIDAIFHEGACSSTTEWNGEYIMENNYQYSKKLLLFCIENVIPFLYASSASVYGNCTQNFIEEQQYEHPLNMYGYSKFLFDQYVRILLPHVSSQICGFRYFNVYGPHEEHKGNMASIIYQMNDQVNRDKNPRLFVGSENFKRDFIYIDDVTTINIWFWQKGISGIFNCGTGQAESFQTIADYVLAFHNKTKIEYIPFPENLKDRYQTFTQANLTKFLSYGYDKPFKNTSEGIKKYLNYLNKNNVILTHKVHD